RGTGPRPTRPAPRRPPAHPAIPIRSASPSPTPRRRAPCSHAGRLMQSGAPAPFPEKVKTEPHLDAITVRLSREGGSHLQRGFRAHVGKLQGMSHLPVGDVAL